MTDAAVTMVILGVVVMLLSGKFPAGLVALGAAVALFASGIWTLTRSFAGFGDPAVVLIASVGRPGPPSSESQLARRRPR